MVFEDKFFVSNVISEKKYEESKEESRAFTTDQSIYVRNSD
jgi:hypothetical protein